MSTLSRTLSATSEGKTSTSSNPPRWPKLQGSPVLDSLHPVIEHSRDVHTHVDKIVEVAQWMAYEDLPMPDYQMPFGVGQGGPDEVIDFILTADSVDTAFTDFSTSGLENPLTHLLLGLFFWIYFSEASDRPRRMALGLVAGLAVANRLDIALLIQQRHWRIIVFL